MNILGVFIDPYELFGTIFGILGVWLTIKQNKLCFPVGIINVGLYAYLFANAKLYADASLQIIYIFLLIYGWLNWNTKKADDEIKPSFSGKNLLAILGVICTLGFVAIYFVLINFTDGHLPGWDSLTMSLSLVAQWMIAKKKIENWIIWIIADIIYIGMYIHKDLYLTAGLYFIFILLAIKGYMEWKASIQKMDIA